jgi:phenylacetate-CoA ligase
MSKYGYWMEDVETLPRGPLADMQTEKLKSMLAYCQTHSEFYKKKYRDAGFSISGIESLEDMAQLPLTGREELEKNQQEKGRFGTLVCNDGQEPGQTIGMTGVKFSATNRPIQLIMSVEDAASQGKLAARGLTCAGVQPKDYMYLMDFPQFNFLYMHMGLGSVNVGSKSILVGMERAERNTSIYTRMYPPTCFYISPTYSRLVTGLLKQTNRQYAIRTVLGWSEPGYSLPSCRSRFREMWSELSSEPKVNICDVYGMVELGLLGFECPENAGLHGFEDAYIYEIIDPDRGSVMETGKEGELVVTHLERTAMPLIRYRTGDITSIQQEPCACGRTHLRLMGIKGRLDQVIRIGGKKIYQSDIEEAMGGVKAFSGDFNVIVDGFDAVQELSIDVPDMENGEQIRRDLESACSKNLGIPTRINLKPKTDMLTFVHRSQKVFRVEDRERLRREADNQRRAET